MGHAPPHAITSIYTRNYTTNADANQASQPSNVSTAETARPPVARNWLWKPWYAKLWWAAIPVYWTGAVASLKVPALAEFYTSALAGYLNMLFFPPTALLVLGFGFVKAWLDRPLSGEPLSDEEIGELEQMRMEDEHWERLGRPHWSVDIYDPRSGGLYIGNPLSLQHPGRRD
ncbi:hypothetical protein [Sphingopyxis alaskensis]|uniref:hypothetical protein n=1 Tax=Sphingopyxis alaskensis TaxID=117207 RepID=UPI00203AFCBD|nr:hypothetical protein [Sphingopyxis alaskensis]MCM3421186.1 hypothetical protein [Sphingopyxis alaskensis]